MKSKPKLKCQIDGCEEIQLTRGLCYLCYRSAYYKVRKGLITWEQLEKIKIALPVTKKRTAFDSWFSKNYS